MSQACVVVSRHLSGMSSRITQNGECVCFWTLDERPSSLLRSVLFRAFAQLRGFVRRSCAVLFSVVSSFSVCVVTSLCDAREDSSIHGPRKLSCTVITIHFIAHGSGADVVIRFARPCTAEGLSVVWWYGG